jgi:wyosine [tRNA(Phe)-imidazoG37] synthetase (radical SAM superfamily)
VMLVRDLNDSVEALHDLASALERIKPDQVHLNLPVRPPAESWVQPSDEEGLLRAQAILGNIVHVILPTEGKFDLGGCENVGEAILSIITRHPMREEDLFASLGQWPDEDIHRILTDLMESGQVQLVNRYGVRFWSAAGTKYGS